MPRTHRLPRVPFTFLVILAMLPFAASQVGTTSLRGVVTDRTGAVIPGAHVTLDLPERGQHQELITGPNGEYLFPQLAPGTWQLTVTAPGFNAQSLRRELLVSQPATADVPLSAGATEQISVQADNTALNTTDATVGDALNGTTVQELPSEGRNVPDLLSLQPGVLYLGHNINANFDSRSGAVAGARSDQGNVTLDGVDNNDQVNGYAFTGVLRSTLDSVDEFRVVTTGTNADSGRSSGAQVNVVTRSGSNQFHGTLYEYNRNTLLAANNWFNKQAEFVSGEPNRPGKLIRNTFGAALGGPLLHDKVFFFGNYESQRTAENVQQTLIVPSASLRAGQISYPSGDATTTLTRSQFASMDPRCSASGTCPLGPGANPAVLALLNQYPLPNGGSLGDGYNTGSFTWSAPNPQTLNTGITRFDWDPSDRNRLFVRGVLQDDTADAAPQFPGQAASSRTRDNTKGIAAGDTFTFTPNLINNGRYGYVRQGVSSRGIGQGSYVNFDSSTIANLTAETRTSIVTVPVHNFVDDLTWTHSTHTLQFGANDRLVHNQLSSDALSFDSAATIGFDISGSGYAGTGQSFDPAAFGLPAVNGQTLPDGTIYRPDKASFTTSYNSAVANLAGIISQVTNQYNYSISPDGSTGTLAQQGALVSHNFRSNELEYYLQDSWRVRRNLTLTFGLRHLIAQTPYEVNGQQAQVTTDLNQWFLTRAADAAQGVPDQTSLTFGPSGQARGLKPYWPMQWGNVAPRFALAFAPDPKTSLRAGFGMVYDHFGQGLVNTFSQYGSYGLQGVKQTPNDALTPDNAPRFSSINAVPAVNGPTPATVGYPFTPSTDPFSSGFATAVGLNDHLSTPYSYTIDVSVQRDLPSGFTLEAAYVGRLGRHLLQQTDLAAPADFADPKSGQDFNTAATVLTKAANSGVASVAPVAYFENLFPDAANAGADGTGTPGASATQNIYNNLFRNYPTNASYIQYSLDLLCSPGCGGTPGKAQGRFYNPQFNSLFSWTSNGTSSYNALQLILRHPMSHGLQADVSYTYSKSLDLGSDAERTCLQCGNTSSSTFSWIINAFQPRQNYGPSDFDTRHLITADWLYLLPVGHGQAFAPNAGRLVNGVVGGWQFTGIARWTSGLPFSAINGTGWEVDWSKQSALVKTGPVKTRTHRDANGAPQAFSDPDALLAGLTTGSGGVRNALPGEAGTRNAFRGDGYFGIDAGLSKFITVHDQQKLRLSWEVFNVTNSVRFDVNPLTSLQNQAGVGSFGVYGATLTQPRIQQLAARYSF